MQTKWLVTPAALALLVVAGCGGGGGHKATSSPSTSESSPEAAGGSSSIGGVTFNNHGSKNVAGMSSVEVEANSFYFEPSVLIGTPGQKITVMVKNATSSTPHNFTLETQHINKDLDPNSTASVQVTFPASGVLAFWCEYHKSSGMAGGVKAS